MRNKVASNRSVHLSQAETPEAKNLLEVMVLHLDSQPQDSAFSRGFALLEIRSK